MDRLENSSEKPKRSTRAADRVKAISKKWLLPQALEDLPLVADPELVADAKRIGADDDGYIPIDNYGPNSELDEDWIRRIRAAFPEYS